MKVRNLSTSMLLVGLVFAGPVAFCQDPDPAPAAPQQIAAASTPEEPQGTAPATDQASSSTQTPGPTGDQADRSTLAPEHRAAPQDRRDAVFYPGDTERFKPLMHKLIGNILQDQKEIWTSPFRMNRQDAKWWIGFTGVTAGLIASDHTTSHWLENSQGQVRWGNRVANIGASYTLIPLVAGFYAYGVIADDPKPREVGVLGGESLLDSLIVVEIIKTIAGRNRPDSTEHPGKFFAGGNSFPSGHAIESWSLASLIAHEYKHTPWVGITAYGLAGVVSAARFGAQKHYASDIVAGGAMGWFIGRYVYNTHVNHAIHNRSWLNPTVMPQMDPGSRSYGLALSFGRGSFTPVVPPAAPPAPAFGMLQ
jgi:membrane-associated phospholipid phosphatase